MGLIYAEWKSTCGMALMKLCDLLPVANTSPELVQFFSNYDIHPAVQKDFPVDAVDPVWEVNVRILALLSVSPFQELALPY